MNPVPLLLIIVTLPLLLGGCGEKSVNEVEPEESVAETKPELKGVNQDELEQRESIWYLKGSETPYTGKAFKLYENGQKKHEGNFKDGKPDGLFVGWHENGQKKDEVNIKDGYGVGLWTKWHENGQKWMEERYMDGESISAKFWNSKGEPVDTFEEAEAE